MIVHDSPWQSMTVHDSPWQSMLVYDSPWQSMIVHVSQIATVSLFWLVCNLNKRRICWKIFRIFDLKLLKLWRFFTYRNLTTDIGKYWSLAKNLQRTKIFEAHCNIARVLLCINTVAANRTFSSVKPSISPSNVALNANPGTVCFEICLSWGF